MSVRARIRATYQGSVDLFGQLREPLVEDVAGDEQIGRCSRELVDEIAEEQPGCWAMAATLLRVILVRVLRRSLARGAAEPCWMAALNDARVGRAVAAMCANPEHAFTLTELAGIAGMSRSVFAVRFAETMRHPPFEFLKTVRLERAARLLAHRDLPIKAIAARVGYGSRSAFTRAFIACHGVAPEAFRAARTRADTEHESALRLVPGAAAGGMSYR